MSKNENHVVEAQGAIPAQEQKRIDMLKAIAEKVLEFKSGYMPFEDMQLYMKMRNLINKRLTEYKQEKLL